jgi:hypothetical protein
MINKNRLFEKKTEFKDAKLIIIYTEGVWREPHYFSLFEEINSHIRIEIIKPATDGNNSPSGLWKQAEEDLLKGDDSLYQLSLDDEVWFVIDTDQWKEHIDFLKQKTSENANFHVAQSNPCFEVWLYYHGCDHKILIETSSEVKRKLNIVFGGGFDSRKHYFLLENAVINAEKSFHEINNQPDTGSTELFRLGKKIFEFVKDELNKKKDIYFKENKNFSINCNDINQSESKLRNLTEGQ